ncbi:hypothetical protein [Pseudomonas phage U1B]|nr:hypothetical protein [Pseudomonas phage T2P]QYV99227.1 hypothetical protein [Pseudomonas phage U1B]QYV99683.1 hypothetical protein [Pseudomonas phage U5]
MMKENKEVRVITWNDYSALVNDNRIRIHGLAPDDSTKATAYVLLDDGSEELVYVTYTNELKEVDVTTETTAITSDKSSLDDVQPIGLITSNNEPPKLMSLNDYIDEFNWHSSADNDYNNVSLELMLNTHHTTLWECDNILVKDVTIKQALKEGVDKQLINTDSSFDELVTHLRLTARSIMDPLDEMDNGIKSEDQAVVNQLLDNSRPVGKFSNKMLLPAIPGINRAERRKLLSKMKKGNF